MTKIWLRLELFELGLLQLPLKYASTLTHANVKNSLEQVYTQLNHTNAKSMEMDTTMSPRARDLSNDGNVSFIEHHHQAQAISFTFWKEAVNDVFQWREQDYKAFWLLLVHFHHKIKLTNEQDKKSEAIILSEEFCLNEEVVPLYKLIIFLFIQTVKPHSLKTKHSLESFNAVWHKDTDAVNLNHQENTSTSTTNSTTSGPHSPLKGSTSPPPPASPHTVGMQDRSAANAYYLRVIRDHLEDLFTLLFPATDLKEEDTSSSCLNAEQIDLLGFLLCAGETMTCYYPRLSMAYPKWTQDEKNIFADKAGKICRFLKENLAQNDQLYPPVGFSLAAAALQLDAIGDDPMGMETLDQTGPNSNSLQKPIIFSSLSKTTIIRRKEEFPNENGSCDLVIFACHDCYIYVLAPVRHVMVIASSNCHILTAPNTGIYFIDRCERVHVTAIAGLIRASNCLDSSINAYTLMPLIMTGENVGVELGPYNSKYPGLLYQMVQCHFAYDPEDFGRWNSFLNLESENDCNESEKEPIRIQSPCHFREICVPVKLNQATEGSSERPFQLPKDYLDALQAQHETVERLRQLVTSDEFDLTSKRAMESVIQAKFKEWLSATGNVRQILDLVHIEKSRSGSGNMSPSLNRSPVKMTVKTPTKQQ